MRALRPHQLFEWLERHRWHRTLGVLGSLYWSVRQRRVCRISRRDGRWVHRFPAGVLVSPWIFETPPDSPAREEFFWSYEPRPGDVVLDVGAGLGAEALLCSRLVGPSGRVLAIEANPTMFACLERSVALNRLTNVDCLEVAIMDREGEVTITDDSGLVANRILADGGDGVRVPATTLQAVMREHGIDRLSLLKMNIEGAEGPALDAAGEVLGLVDHAVIACHDFLADDGGDQSMRTRQRVSEVLRGAGFVVAERRDHPWAWVRDFVYASRPVPDPSGPGPRPGPAVG